MAPVAIALRALASHRLPRPAWRLQPNALPGAGRERAQQRWTKTHSLAAAERETRALTDRQGVGTHGDAAVRRTGDHGSPSGRAPVRACAPARCRRRAAQRPARLGGGPPRLPVRAAGPTAAAGPLHRPLKQARRPRTPRRGRALGEHPCRPAAAAVARRVVLGRRRARPRDRPVRRRPPRRAGPRAAAAVPVHSLTKRRHSAADRRLWFTADEKYLSNVHSSLANDLTELAADTSGCSPLRSSRRSCRCCTCWSPPTSSCGPPLCTARQRAAPPRPARRRRRSSTFTARRRAPQPTRHSRPGSSPSATGGAEATRTTAPTPGLARLTPRSYLGSRARRLLPQGLATPHDRRACRRPDPAQDPQMDARPRSTPPGPVTRRGLFRVRTETRGGTREHGERRLPRLHGSSSQRASLNLHEATDADLAIKERDCTACEWRASLRKRRLAAMLGRWRHSER